MADELQILKNRFNDLYERSRNRSIYCYSDFLNLHEQTILLSQFRFGYSLFGGYEYAERKIAVFGTENEMGYEPDPPLKIIKASPLSQKFSDELTHRDFLGSLMGLGIKRETLGDIIIADNCGYIFCLENMAQFIIDNLLTIRRTSVSCEFCDTLPADALPKPQEKLIIVSSMRLDALISAVYNLSRTKSAALVDGEKVFINSKLSTSTSKPVEVGETISVRGHGRFRCAEIRGDTRKGRLRVLCQIY